MFGGPYKICFHDDTVLLFPLLDSWKAADGLLRAENTERIRQTKAAFESLRYFEGHVSPQHRC